MCNKVFDGQGFKAYNDKGSFNDVCSIECVKEHKNLSNKNFEESLKYYKELHNELSKIKEEHFDNICNFKFNEINQEIEIFEHIYDFTKYMPEK